MPSIRLADLAQQLDAELHGDGDIVITGVASMQSAKAGQITFMVNPKYREHGRLPGLRRCHDAGRFTVCP